MQLSFLSRTTSSSYSFQPIIEVSINNSLVGDKSSPRRQISSNSSALYAIPPPLPAKVKEGLMIVGKPTAACFCLASSKECAMKAAGTFKPISSMAILKRSRSSALSIASCEAPISSTPCFSRTPCFTKSSAQFRAV